MGYAELLKKYSQHTAVEQSTGDSKDWFNTPMMSADDMILKNITQPGSFSINQIISAKSEEDRKPHSLIGLERESLRSQIENSRELRPREVSGDPSEWREQQRKELMRTGTTYDEERRLSMVAGGILDRAEHQLDVQTKTDRDNGVSLLSGLNSFHKRPTDYLPFNDFYDDYSVTNLIKEVDRIAKKQVDGRAISENEQKVLNAYATYQKSQQFTEDDGGASLLGGFSDAASSVTSFIGEIVGTSPIARIASKGISKAVLLATGKDIAAKKVVEAGASWGAKAGVTAINTAKQLPVQGLAVAAQEPFTSGGYANTMQRRVEQYDFVDVAGDGNVATSLSRPSDEVEMILKGHASNWSELYTESVGTIMEAGKFLNLPNVNALGKFAARASKWSAERVVANSPTVKKTLDFLSNNAYFNGMKYEISEELLNLVLEPAATFETERIGDITWDDVLTTTFQTALTTSALNVATLTPARMADVATSIIKSKRAAKSLKNIEDTGLRQALFDAMVQKEPIKQLNSLLKLPLQEVDITTRANAIDYITTKLESSIYKGAVDETLMNEAMRKTSAAFNDFKNKETGELIYATDENGDEVTVISSIDQNAADGMVYVKYLEGNDNPVMKPLAQLKLKPPVSYQENMAKVLEFFENTEHISEEEDSRVSSNEEAKEVGVIPNNYKPDDNNYKPDDKVSLIDGSVGRFVGFDATGSIATVQTYDEETDEWISQDIPKGQITGLASEEETNVDSIVDSNVINSAPETEQFEKITPVGIGSFGNIYNQFKGKAMDAIRFLMNKQDGEAIGALRHPAIGDIDIVWGESGTAKSDGYGLSKIVKYHPEVLNNLQGIINSMKVVSRTSNRVQLESKKHQASVRLQWNGEQKTWLLTAFEKRASTPIGRTTDVGDNLTDLQDDTAPLQNINTLSDDKATNSVPQTQVPERIIPLLKDGTPDYDSMPADMFLEEYSKISSREEALQELQDEHVNTEDAIRKLEDKKTVSRNEKVKNRVKIAELRTKVADIAAVIANNTSTKSEPKQSFAVGDNVRQRYADAPKVYGNEKSIFTPNDEQIKGRYVLTESGAVTASHNPKTFIQSDGFPVTDSGSTVNDRDYGRDKEAQQQVVSIAQKYNGRAIENPVVVTPDGVVISGNNRTMSGELAAENGTDKAYLQHLLENATQYGFTSEQIAEFKNPRIVFETSEQQPYNTETFAKFNAQETKTQNKVEKAIKIGKTIDEKVIRQVSNILDEHETLGEFYVDSKAVNLVIKTLQGVGIINQNEIAELKDGDSLSGTVKDMIETMLVGSVLSEDAVRLINRDGMKRYRQRITKSILPIFDNATLGDYSIADEVSEAIVLLDRARVRKSSVEDTLRMKEMFEQVEYPPVSVSIAKALEESDKGIKQLFTQYNSAASGAAQGQTSMFADGVVSKEQILEDMGLVTVGQKVESQNSNLSPELKAEIKKLSQIAPMTVVNNPSELIGVFGDELTDNDMKDIESISSDNECVAIYLPLKDTVCLFTDRINSVELLRTTWLHETIHSANEKLYSKNSMIEYFDKQGIDFFANLVEREDIAKYYKALESNNESVINAAKVLIVDEAIAYHSRKFASTEAKLNGLIEDTVDKNKITTDLGKLVYYSYINLNNTLSNAIQVHDVISQSFGTSKVLQGSERAGEQNLQGTVTQEFGNAGRRTGDGRDGGLGRGYSSEVRESTQRAGAGAIQSAERKNRGGTQEEPDATTPFEGGIDSQTQTPRVGENNTIVSADRIEELRKRAKDKLSQLNSGFDPELFAILTELSAGYIEAGVRKFADFTNSMVAEFGDKVKPYLASMYEGARRVPGMEQISKEMDSTIYVDNYTQELKDNDTERNTRVSNSTGTVVSDMAVGQQLGLFDSNVQEKNTEGVSQRESTRDVRSKKRIPKRGNVKPTSTGDSNQSDVPNGGIGELRLEQQAEGRTTQTDSQPYPIQRRNGRNFRIENISQPVVPNGEIAKIKANIEAIKLIRELQNANRDATPSEQKMLSQYSGWGGLSTVLATNRSDDANWVSKYGKYNSELKELLTKEEYTAAINSTINAHYTTPQIIADIWSTVSHLGFTGGTILEPAMGSGNFFGAMPADISADSKLIGYELDSITGAIAAKLYPDANVRIAGYETASEGAGSVDLVISNVPFGQNAPYDPKHKDISKFSLHNYFIAKGLRQLRDGGIGVFITSSSTMDGGSSRKFREWSEKDGNADFIGAVRLPNTAFAANAGTTVTTDILFYRKRDGITRSEHEQSYRNLATIREVLRENQYNTKTRQYEDIVLPLQVNEYFEANPKMMLGDMYFAFEVGSGGLYSDTDQTLQARKGEDLTKSLHEALVNLPDAIYKSNGENITQIIDPNEDEILSTFVNRDGKIYEVTESGLEPILGTTKIGKNTYQNSEITSAFIDIKQAAQRLISLEQNSYDDTEIESQRNELSTMYDAFSKKYGSFNRNNAISFLQDDIQHVIAFALENIQEEDYLSQSGKTLKRFIITKADILSKRISTPLELPTNANSTADAVQLSLRFKGVIDVQYISSLLNIDEESAKTILLDSGDVFINPSTGKIEERSEYLSGFVKDKLEIAREYAKTDSKFDSNVAELERVIPTDIAPSDVNFRMSSYWLPNEFVEAFFKEQFGLIAHIEYVPELGEWVVNSNKYSQKNGMTAGMYDSELAEKVLNQRPVTVYRTVADKRVKDIEGTAEAAARMAEINDNFVEFVSNNDSYISTVARIYNDQFNTFVKRKYQSDGGYYPGANRDIKLRQHQSNAVQRMLNDSVLLAHEVGTGKTFTMITGAMEMRRLGIAKKPMIVVQNSTLEQFAASFQQLYPSAKLLVPSEKQRSAEKRQRLFAMIAYGDFDAVIIPQSFVDFIEDSPERIAEKLQQELDNITALAENTTDYTLQKELRKKTKSLEEEIEKISTPTVKDIAKKQLSVEKRLKRQSDRKTDKIFTFEALGVDALFVDEAHAYKKLGFSTSMGNVKGIDTGVSKRAFSMKMKTDWIQSRTGGRNVVFATGTPITNTMAEAWTMMRFISPDLLRRYGIENFDAFASTFGVVETGYEFNASGSFKQVERFKSFMNAPEFINIFKGKTDVVLSRDIPGFAEKLPKLLGNGFTQRIIKRSGELIDFMNIVKDELVAWAKMSKKDRSPATPMVMFTRASQAAIDLRLIDPDAIDSDFSKANEVVRNVKRIYDKTSGYNGSQMIFSDKYQSPDYSTSTSEFKIYTNPEPTGRRFNLYEDMKNKLISMGIPASEIAIVTDMDSKKKEQLFARVNSGEVRIVFGSTEKMGVGVNAQRLLAAVHHVDAPSRPMDFTQRNGRIIRQGNLHSSMNLPVEVLTYGVEKTLDVTAYQRLATKQAFIDQVLSGDISSRVIDDEADEGSVTGQSFEEMMSNLSGSQYALRLTELNGKLRKAELAVRSSERSRRDLKQRLNTNSQRVAPLKMEVDKLRKAVEVSAILFPDGGKITKVSIGNKTHNEKLSEVIGNAMATFGEDYRKNRATEPLRFTINDNPRTLVIMFDPHNDQFSYIMRIEDVEIKGEVGTGGGLMNSVPSKIKNLQKSFESSKATLKEVEESIPFLEKRLSEPNKNEDVVAELKTEIATVTKLMADESAAEEARIAAEQEMQDDEVRFREIGDYSAVEMSLIKAEAVKLGDFMQAPNGKPSKLTERQWLQVRTKAFKEWFGDWEKAYRIEKLRESTPVEITGQEITPSEDIKEYRRNALEYGKSLKGEYINQDTGTKILVSNTGLEKLLSHDKQNTPHIQSIAAIPQLIEESIFIAELQPGKENHKFDSYKYFVSGLKIKGEDYTIKIVVGEKNGDRYYNHSLTEIEKGELLSKIDALSIAFNANNSPETSEIGNLRPLSEFKDKRLISILQTNSSKVVDANGEPMVVYHGTKNEFYEFDTNKSSATGSGSFFTTDKNIADEYMGKADNRFVSPRLVEAFINLKNPFDYDTNSSHKDLLNGYIERKTNQNESHRQKIDNEREFLEQNFDGEIRRNRKNDSTTFIVFNPNQIKSATGNNGDFSGMDNDIRYRDLADVNNVFNEELQQLVNGSLRAGHVFSLGMPSEELLLSGVPDLPIELSATRLKDKSKQENHPFDLTNVTNLPTAIANPIAVFDSKTQDNSKVILTEISSGEKNFVVVIRAQQHDTAIGQILNVNEIRSFYPKDFKQIEKWITADNLLRWIDKEKAIKWFDKQRSNSADVAIPDNSSKFIKKQQFNSAEVIDKTKGLDSATKIIESFENPTQNIKEQKNSVSHNESLRQREYEQNKETHYINPAKRKAQVIEQLQRLSKGINVEVVIVDSVRDLPDNLRHATRGKRFTGFYHKPTEKVYFVANEMLDADDATATFLHEVVSHKGIDGLMGKENADKFYVAVFDSLKTEEQERLFAKYGSKVIAGDETVARMAEGDVIPSTMQRVVAAVRKFFREVLHMPLTITDNDIRYILWKSKNNLQQAKTLPEVLSIVQRDKALQNKLYPETKSFMDKVRDVSIRYRDVEEPPQNTMNAEGFRVSGTKKTRKSNAIQLQESVQDATIKVKLLQDEIKKLGGTIDAFTNPYESLNHRDSRADAAMRKYTEKYIEPLIEFIGELIPKDIKYSEVSDYLLAKHSIERDASGISALSKEKDGKWTYEICQELVDSFENKVSKEELDKLWSMWREATNQILDIAVQSGRMSLDERRDILNKEWRYYVPLRGKDFDFEGTQNMRDVFYYDRTGHGTGGKSPSKDVAAIQALGRSTKAYDPLATLQNMAHIELYLAEVNRANIPLLRLALQYPEMTDLFQVRERWYVKRGEEWFATETKPSQEEITTSVNARKAIRLYEATLAKETDENTIAELKEKIAAERDNIIVTKRELEASGYTGAVEQSHNVVVMRDGIKYVIRMGDAEVAQAINNSGGSVQSWLSRYPGRATRVLAQLATSKNPAFILPNFIRDLQHATMYNFVDGDGNTRDFLKYATGSWKTLDRNIRGNAKPLTQSEMGTLSVYNKSEREILTQKYGKARVNDTLYDIFVMNGGETGYVHIIEPKEYQKKLEKELRTMTGEDLWSGTRKGWKAINNGIDYMANMSENAVRYATFMSQIDNDANVFDAVTYAKNITVNFNRKGKYSKGIGALFMFFNAGVQGAQNTYSLWGNKKGKSSEEIAKQRGRFIFANATLAVIGYASAALMYEILQGLVGDDGEEFQISDYERRTNLIVPMPGSEEGYIKIPIPILFRPFYSLGVLTNDWVNGKIEAGDVLGTFSQSAIDAISPLPVDYSLQKDNAWSVAKPFIPSAIKPITDLAYNADFAGRRINKESPYNPNTPDSELGQVNANKIAIAASKWLNKLGGGNELTPAGIGENGKKDIRNIMDISPSTIEHIITGYTGGIGKMINETIITLTSDIQEVRKIPIVNRFIGEVYERDPSKEYYDIKRNIEWVDRNIKQSEEQGIDNAFFSIDELDAKKQYYKEQRSKLKQTERRINNIKKQMEDTQFGSYEYESMESQIDNLQRQFIKEYTSDDKRN